MLIVAEVAFKLSIVELKQVVATALYFILQVTCGANSVIAILAAVPHAIIVCFVTIATSQVFPQLRKY